MKVFEVLLLPLAIVLYIHSRGLWHGKDRKAS